MRGPQHHGGIAKGMLLSRERQAGSHCSNSPSSLNSPWERGAVAAPTPCPALRTLPAESTTLWRGTPAAAAPIPTASFNHSKGLPSAHLDPDDDLDRQQDRQQAYVDKQLEPVEEGGSPCGPAGWWGRGVGGGWGCGMRRWVGGGVGGLLALGGHLTGG